MLLRAQTHAPMDPWIHWIQWRMDLFIDPFSCSGPQPSKSSEPTTQHCKERALFRWSPLPTDRVCSQPTQQQRAVRAWPLRMRPCVPQCHVWCLPCMPKQQRRTCPHHAPFHQSSFGQVIMVMFRARIRHDHHDHYERALASLCPSGTEGPWGKGPGPWENQPRETSSSGEQTTGKFFFRLPSPGGLHR